MIDAEHLSFAYDSGLVVDGIDLSVSRGECVAILGANGSGKSTLLKLLLGLLKPCGGRVLLAEQDLAGLSPRDVARRLGYVEQSARTPEFSVFEAVLSGRLPHSGGHVGTADLEVVGDTLVAMNLTELSGRRLGSLSGGQLQRVIVARALAQRPSVLLLDEPTNHLDLRAQKDVAERLADAIARLGIAVVLVLHDINLAVHLADRLVFMKSGRLLAVRRPAEVDAPLVQEVYGVPVVKLSSGNTSFFVPQWLEE